jgi:hypothetical protein
MFKRLWFDLSASLAILMRKRNVFVRTARIAPLLNPPDVSRRISKRIDNPVDRWLDKASRRWIVQNPLQEIRSHKA